MRITNIIGLMVNHDLFVLFDTWDKIAVKITSSKCAQTIATAISTMIRRHNWSLSFLWREDVLVCCPSSVSLSLRKAWWPRPYLGDGILRKGRICSWDQTTLPVVVYTFVTDVRQTGQYAFRWSHRWIHSLSKVCLQGERVEEFWLVRSSKQITQESLSVEEQAMISQLQVKVWCWTQRSRKVCVPILQKRWF